MKWVWYISAAVAALASLGCGIGTAVEFYIGKGSLKKADFWGGVAFHGGTAILALWLLLKAMAAE